MSTCNAVPSDEDEADADSCDDSDDASESDAWLDVELALVAIAFRFDGLAASSCAALSWVWSRFSTRAWLDRFVARTEALSSLTVLASANANKASSASLLPLVKFSVAVNITNYYFWCKLKHNFNYLRMALSIGVSPRRLAQSCVRARLGNCANAN